jgi:UDP-N-acetylmuramoyl-tripeptide--D-alanyl-D-alanine ligase
MLDIDTAALEIGAGRRGPGASFDGVSTDSRQVSHGDLFVALKGDRFDGHEFVDQALELGAVGAMVSEPERVKHPHARLIIVDDTRTGLGRLAEHWRARFQIQLVAVTGSNGKTTVKEMLAGCLRAAAGDNAVLATAGNLNNDIGVPLMLLRLRSHHRYAVIEMGMNHLGEISYLTRLAAPTVALVNNAGTAHIGELGSREAIAQAKGEVYQGLSDEGIAVINADDAFAGYWRSLNAGRRVVDFGLDQPALVRGQWETDAHGSLMTVRTPDSSYEVRLQVPGVHNARNALAACAVAHALRIVPQAVARGLAEFEGAKGRLQRKRCRGGGVLVDDTYNANPDSTRAAITVLAGAPGTRILVLGDMGELGAEGRSLHEAIGKAAKEAGIDALLTLGDLSAEASAAFGPGARHFADLEALGAALEGMLGPDVTVLVKGSRFMRMERVVWRFVDGRPAHAGAGDH